MTIPEPAPDAVSSEADRWIVVGSSTNPDAELAVREALAPVVDRANPRLTIIFCSPAHNLAEISRLVQAAVGSGEVIGCSTAGELLRNNPMTGGLLIWALGGEGFAVTTGVGIGDPSTGLRDAAQTAAQCLTRLERKEHTLLFLLADGLCGDQMEVVRGAYDVSGASVPLMGGCAGDDMALQATHQIHSGEILTHAVVAAAITSNAPMAIGIAHGWEPLSQAMLVTGSQGTTLESLDDRPALDVYFETYAAPAEVRNDPAAFFDFAHTRPVGIARRNRTEIRYVYGADYERRTLTIFAEVPQGAMAYLMQGNSASVLNATSEVCALAEQSLGGLPARGFMLLECVARKSLLSSAGLLEESLRLPSVGSDASVGGFYTYGEIARTEGSGGLHNQTVVALALA
jgi:hypothetical protein